MSKVKQKIIINRVYPPTPCRDYDWCAYYDGEEESGHYGHGKTKEIAIENLISNCEA